MAPVDKSGKMFSVDDVGGGGGDWLNVNDDSGLVVMMVEVRVAEQKCTYLGS